MTSCEFILFECDVEDDLPPMYVDPSLVRQALWHLIENSLEASSATGGAVTFKVLLCWDDIFIRITDKGVGFDTLRPASALHPFTSTHSGRMGLGLALCRQIILSHLGSLELLNDVKGGAVAVITLPVRVTPPDASRSDKTS